MTPLVLLAIGMVAVVGGILALRLHAFLALILGAFLIAALTPEEWVRGHEEVSAGIEVGELGEAGSVVLKPTQKQKVIVGGGFVLGAPDRVGRLSKGDEGGYSWEGAELEVGDRIVHHTYGSAAAGVAKQSFARRVATGFGNTATGVGILIAMAAIVGKCLMDSGAAERIVLALQRLLGERGSPLAFIGGGFTLGIPVFFDTVFYLMMPLGKALHIRTGRNYLLYVLCIVAGGTMAHSLVPPTPGPLFVADALGIDLGKAILGGLVVGLGTVTIGLLWALLANRIWTVPLRPSAELSEADLDAMANRDPDTLPPLWASLLPIALPVFLLAGGTFSKWIPAVQPVFSLLGDKNVALTVAALVGLVLLAKQTGRSRQQLQENVGSALASGATIILITAAGGAFGHVLRQTGIAGQIQELMGGGTMGIIPLAWVITAVVRTAQGSATVAMITAVGIVSPLVAGVDLPYSPLYVALAIGCGSKPISWMNDSGFWVISKMSGLTEGEMLKTNTVMGILMGAAGLGICMLGATYAPEFLR